MSYHDVKLAETVDRAQKMCASKKQVSCEQIPLCPGVLAEHGFSERSSCLASCVDGSNLGRRCLGDCDLGALGTANVHAGLPHCLCSLSLEEIHLALSAKEQMARAKFIALERLEQILALLAIQWWRKLFCLPAIIAKPSKPVPSQPRTCWTFNVSETGLGGEWHSWKILSWAAFCWQGLCVGNKSVWKPKPSTRWKPKFRRKRRKPAASNWPGNWLGHVGV